MCLTKEWWVRHGAQELGFSTARSFLKFIFMNEIKSFLLSQLFLAECTFKMLFVYVGLSITIEDICYKEVLSTNKSLVKVNVLYNTEIWQK